MTKPIIVVRVPCKLLYVIQVKEFLIKCLTSWPYLISEFLVTYITIVASDWPRTFFTPKVFLFSIFFTFTVQFLLNISEGLAAPFYRTTTPPANPVVYANSMFNVSVIELVGTTFTSTVMDPTKVRSCVYVYSYIDTNIFTVHKMWW